MMSFTLADLRKSSGTDFDAITKALQQKDEYSNDDADFFKLTKDKAGNGSAVLRFLQAHPDDALPWVQIYSHSFQGPTGRWYIENCRSTLKEDDPVQEKNRELWALSKNGDKKAEERAKKEKRKLQYVSNVYVVSNPSDPSLEGKVMRFRYGKKIFEKIADKGNPTFADEKPVQVFSTLEGADFKLRMKVVDDYPNYDSSVFSEVKPLADTDEKMLEILNAMKPLKELIDPSKFKSYDELKKKYDSVMNSSPASTKNAESAADRMKSEPSKKAPEPKASKAVPQDDAPESQEDIEAYFKGLTSDDS